MKRSEVVESINDFIKRTEGHTYPEGISSPGEWILQHIERVGMQAPKVAAKVIKGSDYRFGAGCSMRCDCEDCNPNFMMNVWEKE